MDEKTVQAKRIVLKLGTQIVIRENGALAGDRLADLVGECAALISEGKELLVVSSGAVGLGRQALNLKEAKLTLPEKQACAAVGQNLLMDVYRDLFGRHGFITAQLLLTALDFSDRKRYLNLRETLEKLLELKVIPIINENDTVSTTELEEDKTKSFGDNDKLSAIVASKLGADLLAILTNVDGIYTENPLVNPEAKLIPVIEGFEQLRDIITDGKSTYGRGGMTSKVEAAKIAAISGVHTLITSGLKGNALDCLKNGGRHTGTMVVAKNAIPGRKRWLGLASGYSGVVRVNEGAKRALVEHHASLLPSGIVGVQGDFQPRQVVSIQDEEGTELGRGLIHFSAEDTRKIQGRQSKEIAVLIENSTEEVVIHRDNLVIYQEYES
jgi:glutamate 5-kinase